MRQILDLHLHSRFSRACSPRLTIRNVAEAAEKKGVDIIGTGDFTYPAWFSEIEKELSEIGDTGLFRLKDGSAKTRFILSTEVSLIYKDGDRARRIHLVVHAPSLEAVKELNRQLDRSYNIRSDGRPILGMSAPDFCKLCFGIDGRFLVYPAHIWTPWYSVFGSKSGFDSLEECFHEYADRIYAIETGLSSDPEMNWRLSALDRLTVLSNSDSHSLENIGREANVMDFAKEKDISYNVIYDNIKGKKNMAMTIEFFPEEGMYHVDGHRSCNFSCLPEESRRLGNICPVCKKPLIIGVMNRVEELSDRPLGYRPEGAVPFLKLIELDKIIADSLGIKSRSSSAVAKIYRQAVERLGSELHILISCSVDDIENVCGPMVAEGVKRVREGRLEIKPGFDGQYGKITIFSKEETSRRTPSLF